MKLFGTFWHWMWINWKGHVRTAHSQWTYISKWDRQLRMILRYLERMFQSVRFCLCHRHFQSRTVQIFCITIMKKQSFLLKSTFLRHTFSKKKTRFISWKECNFVSSSSRTSTPFFFYREREDTLFRNESTICLQHTCMSTQI